MKKFKKYLSKYLMILIGNLFIAIGTVFFIVPSGFITGGVTGIALALENLFGLPIAYGIAAISIALFILGFLFLGREFAVSTLLSTVSYPVWVWICELITSNFNLTTNNLTLNLAGATIFYGYGVAFVMRQGASTGGVDTISMILHKLRGISLSKTISLFEILTMLVQLSYSSIEEIMGGILITLLYTEVLNRHLAQGIARIQVQIFSKHYEQLADIIHGELERGSTLFRVQGGYTRQDTFALQTVLNRRELFLLKEYIKKIDPKAFVTVSEVTEVTGLGFTYDEDDI